MFKNVTAFVALAVAFVLLTVTGQLFGQGLTVPTPNFPPPPGSFNSTQLYWQLYANGVVFKDASLSLFSQSLPPPPPGGAQIHSFNATVRMQYSLDGGATFIPVTVPNVVVSVRVSSNPSRDNGNTRGFDTEMLTLIAAGGGLPPGFMIRESPTLQSLGKMQISTTPDGQYRVSSFFDIFTELSVDNGNTWMPATNGAGHMALQGDSKPSLVTTSPNLPSIPSHYISTPDWLLWYTNTVVIKDIRHEQFLHNDPPPSGGGTQTHNFGMTVHMNVSTDGGLTFTPYTAPAQVSVSVHHTGGSGSTQTFDTEMLQLDISGGTLPPNVMIRESPTKASLGKTTEDYHSQDGSYRIASFFDIFTEVSANNGASWLPAEAPMYMEVEPNPPSIVTTNSNLPPIEGHYLSPAEWALQFANGVILREISHENFSQSSPPPPLGGSGLYNFGSTLQGQISMDGGNTFSPISLTGMTGMQVRHTRDEGSDSFFDTEMLSLSLSGGAVMIRESPTLPSKGKTSIRTISPAQFQVSSFFDVFTEMSLDGGQTWSPATGHAQIELVSDSVLICGKKYEDMNGNGVQDPGENGLAGWTIKVTDANNNVVTITTDANGNHCIRVPAPGTYKVEEVQQAGWMQTGGQPYYTLTTAPGQNINGIDFGNFKSGSVSGTKFNDMNENGVRDPGEPGLPGWTIRLTKTDQQPPSDLFPTTGGTEFIGGTMTSININLYPAHGGGTITLCAWGNTTILRANPSGPTPADSMLTEITWTDMIGTLPSPYPNDTFHFKHVTNRRSYGQIKGNSFPAESFFDVFYEFELPLSMGGGAYVNYDPMHIQSFIVNTPPSGQSYIGVGTAIVNKNNITDTLGIVKIVNHCISSDGLCNGFTCSKQPPNPNPPGTPIGTTCVITDANGNYFFGDLPRGSYTLHEVPQAGWTQTTPDPSTIVIISGMNRVGIDFGNHHGSKICIVKYFDENHSQTLDGTELPMPGVQFTLNGLPIGPTDAVGKICVDNLSPGTYTISEIVPAGYVVSFPKSNEMMIQLGADLDTTIVWLNGAARDTAYYRTGTMRDWATAVDGKGKSKAIKCKPDKVDFKFNIVAPNPLGTANGGVKVIIGMLSSGVLYHGKAKTDTLLTWSNAKDFTYTGTIAGGETLQVEGIGFKGKPVKPAFEWATSQKKTKGKVTVFKKNDPRLPMPNLHNVGVAFENPHDLPIVIGAPANIGSVTHLRYKDVKKSLYDHAMMHTGPAVCLTNKKQIKSMPAKKVNNKLFAEALTLALNLTASRNRTMPHGLGDLIYDNHKDGGDAGSIPFNGKKVDSIFAQVNLFLSCATNPKPVATGDDYYNVIKRINDAFNDGTIDTLYWSCDFVILNGVKPLKSIPYLRAEPGEASPRTVIDNPGGMYTGPQSSALMQNYPNPFNPTTTIQFELREPSIVTLKIFNTLGQEVATLIDQASMEDGSQEIEFDASTLPSGVYFYRLVANGIGDPDEGTIGQTFVSVKKMMLIR